MKLTMQQEGGLARWKGIPKKERSEIMKNVRSGKIKPAWPKEARRNKGLK